MGYTHATIAVIVARFTTGRATILQITILSTNRSITTTSVKKDLEVLDNSGVSRLPGVICSVSLFTRRFRLIQARASQCSYGTSISVVTL